ncbi:hypothetical protein L0156_15330 [bacterium]|nr:hypothetical protein [bacterium]
MKERKMIEIHQEISSHLNDAAIVQLLKRDAPLLLEYMRLWQRDLGDIILASTKISLFKKVVVRVVKAFGFGDQVPGEILLALVAGNCGSSTEAQCDSHSSEPCSNRIKKFEMRRPDLPKQEIGKQFRHSFRRPSPSSG